MAHPITKQNLAALRSNYKGLTVKAQENYTHGQTIYILESPRSSMTFAVPSDYVIASHPPKSFLSKDSHLHSVIRTYYDKYVHGMTV